MVGVDHRWNEFAVRKDLVLSEMPSGLYMRVFGTG